MRVGRPLGPRRRVVSRGESNVRPARIAGPCASLGRLPGPWRAIHGARPESRGRSYWGTARSVVDAKYGRPSVWAIPATRFDGIQRTLSRRASAIASVRLEIVRGGKERTLGRTPDSMFRGSRVRPTLHSKGSLSSNESRTRRFLGRSSSSPEAYLGSLTVRQASFVTVGVCLVACLVERALRRGKPPHWCGRHCRRRGTRPVGDSPDAGRSQPS